MRLVEDWKRIDRRGRTLRDMVRTALESAAVGYCLHTGLPELAAALALFSIASAIYVVGDRIDL